jgi:hypothetical protein
VRVTVTTGHAGFARALEAEAAQLARTARRAVNELAWRAVEDLRGGIRQAFDRPTPYVQDGATVQLARGEENTATVEWKLAFGNKSSGPGAGRVLRAQIEGGARAQKRFERALRLGNDTIAVPARFAELDQYGNLKASALVKILSELKAFGEVGYLANRSANRPSRGVRRRERYFMLRQQTPGGLRPGIYLRGQKGKPPQMVIAFVKPATYKPRFNPAAVVRDSVAHHRLAVWQLALQRRLPNRDGRGNAR